MWIYDTVNLWHRGRIVSFNRATCECGWIGMCARAFNRAYMDATPCYACSK